MTIKLVDTSNLLGAASRPDNFPDRHRSRVADCILRSLNQTVPAVDQKWANLAAKRLHDIKAGAVNPVAGDGVLEVPRSVGSDPSGGLAAGRPSDWRAPEQALVERQQTGPRLALRARAMV